MTTIANLDTLGDGSAAPDAPPPSGGKKITGKSPTAIAFGRLRKDKLALVSGTLVVLLFLAAIFAPVITSLFNVTTNPLPLVNVIDPVQYLPKAQYGPPLGSFTWSHPLGIDPTAGNDNLAFLLYGLRTDLAIAVLATVFSTVIGLALGLMAGFLGGWVDSVIQFFTDAFLAFPFLLGALALAPILTSHFSTDASALSTASFIGLCAILVFFGWMPLTRLIRGNVIQLREREFVQAAKVLG
ncbi:MAG: ABC transporter permease, partial [Nocardioidaceae bacterium]